MKTLHLFLACALAASVAVPAQSTVLVDDFSSGSASLQLGAAPIGQSVSAQQVGTMASGYRSWTIGLYGPASLGGSLDISPSGFTFREDLGVSHRFDWFYGATYIGHDHPMHLDLSGEDRLRFSFADAPLGLNFNVLLYYRGEIDNYSQMSLNIAPHPGAFDVDFAFSDFAARIAIPARPADFSDVSGIYLVTQSGGYVGTGGEGFRMTSISAVPEPSSALLALAGVGVIALRRRRARATKALVGTAFGAALLGLLCLQAGTAAAAVPATTVSWVTASGTALSDAPIDLWLRLAVSERAETPLVLDGVTPMVDLATELPGWARVDFIDTQSWVACGNTFMPGNCFEATAPYRLEWNTGSDAFGVYVNGHTTPLNLTLQPGQSHDFLLGSFVPQNGPVPAGTYTLDNAGLQLFLTGVDTAGATVYHYVGLGSACNGAPSCTVFSRDVSAVPEPSTGLLMLLGGCGVVWRRAALRRVGLEPAGTLYG